MLVSPKANVSNEKKQQLLPPLILPTKLDPKKRESHSVFQTGILFVLMLSAGNISAGADQ